MNDEEAEKQLDEHIQELAAKLDIDINNLIHFTIIGGIEIIGEVIPDETKKPELKGWITLFEPIKIIRESWVTDEGDYDYKQLFIEWNPCMKEPYIPINPMTVLSSIAPNKVAIMCYLETVYGKYFPELQIELTLEEDEVEEKSNVINMQEWINKRG